VARSCRTEWWDVQEARPSGCSSSAVICSASRARHRAASCSASCAGSRFSSRKAYCAAREIRVLSLLRHTDACCKMYQYVLPECTHLQNANASLAGSESHRRTAKFGVFAIERSQRACTISILAATCPSDSCTDRRMLFLLPAVWPEASHARRLAGELALQLALGSGVELAVLLAVQLLAEVAAKTAACVFASQFSRQLSWQLRRQLASNPAASCVNPADSSGSLFQRASFS